MLTPEQAQRLAVNVFGCADDAGQPQGAQGAPRGRAGSLTSASMMRPGDDADLPRVPERLGQYRITRLIGQGGMGAIYHAERDDPHLVAAIKVIKQGMVSRRNLQHLYDEAEILGSLHHAGIAQIHDAGTFEDQGALVPYFVMEYIPNARSLTRFAREHDLTTSQKLELMARVCDAVHYGHLKGVIHRDLKPANILIGEEDRSALPGGEGRVDRFTPAVHLPQPKVIDFGVAESTGADVTLATTRSGVCELVGTLQYMSPEQFDGDPRNITALSDIYSLGVVLYQLVCGKLPYDVSGHSIASAALTIRHTQPPSPAAVSRSFRGNIEAIMLKAMAKEPSKRYSSAADLARDIRRHLAGEPVEARPPTRWVMAMRWVARHPIPVTLAACLSMLAGAIAVTYGTVWYLNRQPARLLLSQDMRRVELLSRTGKTIHTWEQTGKEVIRFAELVKQPDSMGSRTLAILGFERDQLDPYGGHVVAYDVNADLNSPYWTDRVDGNFQPLLYQSDGTSPHGFGVAWARLMDIFPDDGDELVVAFSHAPRSGAIVRVNNLKGEILYQLCHDGGIHDVAWHEASGTLLLCGLNSELHWNSVVPGATWHHARVLFAVKPQREQYWTKWTTLTGRGHTTDLVWYYALPPSLWDRVSGLRWTEAFPGEAGEGFFRHAITIDDPAKSGLSYLLDVHGNEYPEARLVNDEWKLNPGAPPLGSLDLVQLPRGE
jgi:serine/threonine protein kinase